MMTIPKRLPAVYKTWLFSLIMLFFLGISETHSQITFEENYGGMEDDIGQCVKQTQDSGYICCGYTRSGSAGDYDLYILRTDAFGDTLWTKTMGGSGYDAGYSLVITPDNGFLICSTLFHPGKAHSDIWLVRLNPNGDTLWTKSNFSTTDSRAHSVQLTSSDGYILTGTREDATGTGHMFLMETDANGDSLWSKEYPFWATSGGNSVITTNDDGFLICGYIDRTFPTWNRNLGLVKTNNQGDTLWTKQVGGLAYEMGWSVCENTLGGYLAAGYTTGLGATSGDLLFAKVSIIGELEWLSQFGKTGLDIAYDVTTTSDLNYIATGNTAEQGSELQEAWLIKLDQAGDTLWTQSFGDFRKSFGYSVQQTNDGGFVFCGSTNASGTGLYDVFLVKTNDEGGVITSHLSDLDTPANTCNVYPNPSDGIFTIASIAEIKEIRITTLSGKIVLEKSVLEQSDFSIDLTTFPPGVYFLEIFTSPRGRTIDLSFNIVKSLLSSLSSVGDVKLFWSIIS